MDTIETCEEKVVKILNSHCIKASYEYPGFILISIGDCDFCYGTINGYWSGDDGKSNGIEMEMYPPDTDPEIIAIAITATLPKEYRETCEKNDIAQCVKE